MANDDEATPPRQENNDDMLQQASSEVRYPAKFETYQERRQQTGRERESCAKEGFTQIPNAILDQHLTKINNLAELKITLYVIRKTLGYQKTWDRISHSQFEEATGLSSQSVKNGLKAALKFGLVVRRNDGQYFQYSIQLGHNLAHLDEKVGHNLAPQKKESLNKNLKKDDGGDNDGFDNPSPHQPPPLAPEFQSSFDNQEKPEPQEAIPKELSEPKKPKTRAGWKSDPRILAWQRFAKLKGFRREHGYFPETAQARHILENIPDTPDQLERWAGLIEVWLDKRFFIGNIYDLVDVFTNGWKPVGRSPTRPPAR